MLFVPDDTCPYLLASAKGRCHQVQRMCNFVPVIKHIEILNDEQTLSFSNDEISMTKSKKMYYTI